MKKTLIALVTLGCVWILYTIVQDYFLFNLMIQSIPKTIKIEGGVASAHAAIEISDDVTWQLIGKALATILGTFLGIKLINKYVK